MQEAPPAAAGWCCARVSPASARRGWWRSWPAWRWPGVRRWCGAGAWRRTVRRRTGRGGRCSGPSATTPTPSWQRPRALRSASASSRRWPDVVVAAGGRSGALIVLDDVHWADRSSLLLLHHLAGRLPESAVLAVATFRPAAPDGSLPAALPELTRARHTSLLLGVGPGPCSVTRPGPAGGDDGRRWMRAIPIVSTRVGPPRRRDRLRARLRQVEQAGGRTVRSCPRMEGGERHDRP